MRAIQFLCSDAYGCMLWNLSSSSSEQFFKSWNTSVKLVFGLPRSTFTYLIEGHFALDHTSLRNQILSRYPGFYRNLLQSPSKEVRVLARLVSTDPRSPTCSNLKYLKKITELSQPHLFSSARIRLALPTKQVPEAERWRLGLLDNLIVMRKERYLRVEDTKAICAMIDSLCST